MKLVMLCVADMIAKKIIKKPDMYDETTLFFTISAIEKIRDLYYDEFAEYI
jgi:hypothetical protein